MANASIDALPESETSSISSSITRRDSVLGRDYQQFIHSPLTHVESEIRVCDLLESAEDSSRVFSLRTVPLSSNVGQYTCVSWVWGHEDEQGYISTVKSRDGRWHEVRPNLRALLVRLWDLGFRKNLWIDAMCINQKNKAERAQQVKMMGQIYGGAKEVLVALDTSTASVPRAPDFVRAALEGLANNQHLSDLVCFSDPVAGRALQKLLSSLWFRRAWTVQEIVLSRDATIIYSGGLLPWSTFKLALENWQLHRMDCCHRTVQLIDKDLHDACYDAYNALKCISRTREKLPHGFHLIEAFIDFERRAVTDVKDKAYAFYGLHTMSGQPPPAPDYLKEPAEVFTELALWFLLNKSISLLVLCLEMPGRPDVTVPSWVPTLSSAPFKANVWRTRLSCYPLYNCDTHFEREFHFIPPDTLALPGVCIDQIQDCSQTAAYGFDSWPERSDLLREWLTYYRDGEVADDIDIDAAFAETLIAGCTGEGVGERRANEGDIEEWRVFLKALLRDGDVTGDYPCSLTAYHVAAVCNRRLFRTRSGRLGLGPEHMKEGDSIWMLCGGKVPFILRQATSDSSLGAKHTLIGPAYLQGAMDGQAFSLLAKRVLCYLI